MLRRTLFRWLAALGVAPWRSRPSAAADVRGLADADKETLRALGAAVLPRALGREKQDAIVAGFLAWLRNYRAGADRGHGYGFSRLAIAPESPAAGYAAQLAAFEKAAREKGAPGFDKLQGDDRRALIDAALRAAKVERLPERPDGRHVASDLRAFFYRSSEANDLCYRAEIGKDTCRDLSDSPQAPRKLAEGGAAPNDTRAETRARRGDAGS